MIWLFISRGVATIKQRLNHKKKKPSVAELQLIRNPRGWTPKDWDELERQARNLERRAMSFQTIRLRRHYGRRKKRTL